MAPTRLSVSQVWIGGSERTSFVRSGSPENHAFARSCAARSIVSRFRNRPRCFLQDGTANEQRLQLAYLRRRVRQTESRRVVVRSGQHSVFPFPYFEVGLETAPLDSIPLACFKTQLVLGRFTHGFGGWPRFSFRRSKSVQPNRVRWRSCYCWGSR